MQRKLTDLNPSQHRRLLNTGLLLVAFRVGLWVVPYRILRRWAECPRNTRKVATDETKAEVVRNVVSVARFIPEATCLTQALTAHVLLRREGFDPKLQLGVAKDPAGTFKAHAWIECDGENIVGDFSATLPYATLRPVTGQTGTSTSDALAAPSNT